MTDEKTKPQPSGVVAGLTRVLVPGLVVAYLLAITAGLLLLVYGALAGSWHGIVGGAVLCLFGSRGVWKILLAGQGAAANQATLTKIVSMMQGGGVEN